MLMHMINSESQNNALCEESNKMEESNRMDQSFEMSRSASGINPQLRKNLVVYIGVALATVVLIICIVVGLTSTNNHNLDKQFEQMTNDVPNNSTTDEQMQVLNENISVKLDN